MSITVAAVVGLIVGLMVGVPLGLVGRPRWWTVCLRLPEELHRRLREEATVGLFRPRDNRVSRIWIWRYVCPFVRNNHCSVCNCNRIGGYARDGSLAQHLAAVSLGPHSNLAITASPVRRCPSAAPHPGSPEPGAPWHRAMVPLPRCGSSVTFSSVRFTFGSPSSSPALHGGEPARIQPFSRPLPARHMHGEDIDGP
jgi:hypothetical protein